MHVTRWSVVTRWSLASILGVAALLLSTTAAVAHVSGIVPQARLSAEGREVQVTWWAAPDDIADIGVGLGLLPPETVDAFLGEGDRYPTEEEELRFARAPELSAYLLERFEIRQDGRVCDGEVHVPDDVLAEGADYRFACPEVIEEVAVHITLLHDRDERHRTFSVDGTVWSEVHTADRPEHAWDATRAATGAGPGRFALLAGGLAAAFGGTGAVLRWWRRPQRRAGAEVAS